LIGGRFRAPGVRPAPGLAGLNSPLHIFRPGRTSRPAAAAGYGSELVPGAAPVGFFMSLTSPLRFRIPARMPTRAVIALVAEHSPVDATPPTPVHRTYLDTADWRLYTAGWLLEVDEERHATGPDRGVTVTLRGRQSGAAESVVALSAVPSVSSDLPSTPIWARVAAGLEGRRLLPQVEMEARLQRLAVLDDEQKTTARVLLERYLFGGRSGSGRHLVRIVTVNPVRGYDKSAARVAASLSGAGLTTLDEPLPTLALRLLREPEPGSKPGAAVELKRSMPAIDAVSAIVDRLLEQMLANEFGTREQLDIEFLHDFRVALRRTRSLLRQAHSVLPVEPARWLAGELGWLGAVTGPVRDLDVHLEELAAETGHDLDSLRAYLENRRQEAQLQLTAALDSDRYRDLLAAWQRIGGLPVDPAGSPDARRPVGEVADEYIERALRRVLRRGKAIDDSSPPEALHDLRKRAKELRYLLESFQTLYPDDERSMVVRELKALQDNLGEYQDCQVQAAALREMADELFESRAATAMTLMTMGQLAEAQENRQRRAREEFAARFERFSSAANRKRFDHLLSKAERSTP
jgi:CHAD domain-containing protein